MNNPSTYSAPYWCIKRVCLFTALAAVSCCLLFLNGCKPKPESEPASVSVTATQTVTAVPTLTALETDALNRKNVDNLMKNMSESERAAFQKLLDQQNAAARIEDDSNTTVVAENLPTFFPLTDELKQIIDDALRALRMDLPYEEKLRAIEALDGIYNPAILEAVSAALDEANVDIREAALDSIMDLNDPVVIPVVMKALDDEDPDIREYALDAVMDIDDERLNDVFDKALDDENVDVRDNAVDLMLFIESPNILPSLAKAMNDPDEDIRDKALITIEDIPDPRAIDILIQQGLLNDNETIQEDTMDSLEFIFDREFKDYQEARSWWDANRNTWVFDE